MTYYHVRVTQASRSTVAEVRLDITFDELERRFLQPYRLGQPIAIAGKSIPTDDLERVRISKTENPSDHYRSQAEEVRSRRSGVVLSTEWYIADLAEDVTDEFITGAPGSDSGTRAAQDELPRSPVDTKRVFVVHGRNGLAREAMFTFLRSLGLRPLEWSEAVHATGEPTPYIGQVLDRAFASAQAVIVLFTPDDEARLRDMFRAAGEPPHETELTGQARPNVLFEAGMAMGHSQKRTILVELGTLRPFSDIAGRHMIRIDNTSQRRQELAQRLGAAGCAVNLDGTDWHTAGDFDAALDQNSPKPQQDITGTLEEQRFDEILRGSRDVRTRISRLLDRANHNRTTTEAQDLLIELGALAGKMSSLGMHELNQRLEGPGDIREVLGNIAPSLAYLEVHIINRSFEDAKRKFASYDSAADDE